LLNQDEIVPGRFTGIAAEVLRSVNCCPTDVKERTFQNILVTGGLTNLTGFKAFLDEQMTRSVNTKTFRESLARSSKPSKSLVTEELRISSKMHPNPNNSVFEGCVLLQAQDFFEPRFVERSLFLEMGMSLVRRHFYAFQSNSGSK
jgi:actin-related protein